MKVYFNEPIYTQIVDLAYEVGLTRETLVEYLVKFALSNKPGIK